MNEDKPVETPNSETDPETIQESPTAVRDDRDPQPYQPPMMMAPPPAPKQGGFGRGFGMGIGLGLGFTIMMVVLTVITGLLSIFALGAMVSAATPEASTETKVVWGPEGASGKLRAISINGAIMNESADGALFSSGAYGYEIAEELDGISEGEASAVVLLVNTPGGTITGSKAISDAVERYQERTGQKVYVHVEGMSASGGVYSTASADEIISDHGSMIGSIGVVFGPFSQFENVTSIGNLTDGYVEAESITQEYITAGTSKDFGNPYRPMTDEERQVFQASIDNEYDAFVTHVAENRGIEPDKIINELGASLFDPVGAQEAGLIDGVMGRDEFFRYVAEQVGLDPDDTKVEKITEPSGFASLLGVKRPLGQSLPLAALEGEESLVNQTICGGSAPLVIAGEVAPLCGR